MKNVHCGPWVSSFWRTSPSSPGSAFRHWSARWPRRWSGSKQTCCSLSLYLSLEQKWDSSEFWRCRIFLIVKDFLLPIFNNNELQKLSIKKWPITHVTNNAQNWPSKRLVTMTMSKQPLSRLFSTHILLRKIANYDEARLYFSWVT